MKRTKRIYILLGILLVASIATIGVIRLEERKEKIKNSDDIIMELSSDSVESLSWEYESESLAFHKEEDKWIYDEDEAFPVDEEKIKDLLKQFEEFGVAFVIEEVEDYDQYGLKEPVCTIKLSTKDQSYEILLGNFSSMDSQRYVSIGDGNVYLVNNDPLDYFDVVLGDMIDHDEAPSFDKVTKIQFAGANSYSILYEEEGSSYNDEDVYFVQKDGESHPLDTARVNSYLRNITNLDLSDYVTYKVTDEELKSYGLDTPELSVIIDYTRENEEKEESTETFVLYMGLDPEEKKAAKEVEKEEDKGDEEKEVTAYVRIGESQIVYRISSDDKDNLLASSYDSLRHLQVLFADFDNIKEFDISLEDTNYTITTKKKGDETTYYYQEKELDIADFQNALESLSAESFTKEEPTRKKEIGLRVYLDNEKDLEVQIELYRYDGAYCLAVVDGEPVSFVQRSNVVDLIEAVYAFVLS